MSERRIITTAEAVCAALHDSGWGLRGEPQGARGTTYFMRGEAPEAVAVRVYRMWDDDMVVVEIEFHNLSMPPAIKKGSISCRINCNSVMLQSQIENATQAAITKCLQTYLDVLERKGVAGPTAIRNTRR